MMNVPNTSTGSVWQTAQLGRAIDKQDSQESADSGTEPICAVTTRIPPAPRQPLISPFPAASLSTLPVTMLRSTQDNSRLKHCRLPLYDVHYTSFMDFGTVMKMFVQCLLTHVLLVRLVRKRSTVEKSQNQNSLFETAPGNRN